MTFFKKYYTVYEGYYKTFSFELEIFEDGDWQFIWLEKEPWKNNLKELEEMLYEEFKKLKL